MPPANTKIKVQQSRCKNAFYLDSRGPGFGYGPGPHIRDPVAGYDTSFARSHQRPNCLGLEGSQVKQILGVSHQHELRQTFLNQRVTARCARNPFARALPGCLLAYQIAWVFTSESGRHAMTHATNASFRYSPSSSVLRIATLVWPRILQVAATAGAKERIQCFPFGTSLRHIQEAFARCAASRWTSHPECLD